MHSVQTKDKFIELRSQGRNLCQIAEELKVSKRTLVAWNREFQQQIRQLRAVELEARYDKILLSREKELKWMAGFQEKMADLLNKRQFNWMKDRDLLRLFLEYRRETEKVRAEVLAPLDEPDVAPSTTSSLPEAATAPAPALDVQVQGNGSDSPRSAPTLPAKLAVAPDRLDAPPEPRTPNGPVSSQE